MSEFFVLSLIALAASAIVALGLSLLSLGLRRRAHDGAPPAPGRRGHWSSDDHAERFTRVYFQKERRARALRERERQARAAEAEATVDEDPAATPGDGQASAPPTLPDERRYRAVLELHGEMTPTRIRAAYLRLVAAYHPDKVAGLGPKLQRLAEEETKAINEAYAFFRKRYGF